jgi:Ca2+-binding RTX toxin-like protein
MAAHGLLGRAASLNSAEELTLATLLINGSFDYSSRFLFNIDTINFTAPAIAVFSGTQLYGNQLIPNQAVDGSSGLNWIVVNSGIQGFSAAGWTFTNWESTDRLIVNGSQWGETLVGSSRNDIIRGNAGSDTIRGGAGKDIVEGGTGSDNLDGGANTDTLSYEHSAFAVTVNLGTNSVSGGDAAGDRIAGFENVIGSNASDRLTGNAGNNFLTGGYGADILTGGGGADRFNYTDVSNSLPGGPEDIITDFSQGQHDQIRLAAIDAIAGGFNDAFRFIGTAGFQHAGDLRYIRGFGQTVIQGDINGDGRADFEITLTGSFILTGDDFIL